MSDIQVYIKDIDDEGQWMDIDEEFLDLSIHDARIIEEAYERGFADGSLSVTEEIMKAKIQPLIDEALSQERLRIADLLDAINHPCDDCCETAEECENCRDRWTYESEIGGFIKMVLRNEKK